MENKRFTYTINNRKFVISNGAFGSGEHETTKGCLKLIGEMNLNGKSFLDIGCGTGILSIAASMCGAENIVGFDISYKACVTSKLNIIANNLDNIYIACGDNNCIKSKFDVIVANIYVDIILNLLEYNFQSLKSEGELVLSGIPIEDAYFVKSKYINSGFKFIRAIYHEDFVTMLYKKL
ncbi:50S ribosomal protein L11 methyltransferase [Deferribacterales bacterium Es71-Z0220]|jgi:ribosomal protein L11 methyltransferase|uniref:50S ribosomal protein L11 methyltransferase n=1 Tax=Deferrivibrio essentukiensis TaxID=2880922 RepID=UPI001F6165DF|nr:50S ribosomal protein L11 methyltransferase [Deferrivibrio essentukiensis]MBZ4672174.1 ribosomal methyltransferase [Deferribacteraceae bacterium]MCB4204927.1 50S ribosomal protein L11 methyltransferase [Deferrivibrio essentukiensis]